MHAISSYRGNRPTNKQTHPATNIQDQLQYTAPQQARSVISNKAMTKDPTTPQTHCYITLWNLSDHKLI